MSHLFLNSGLRNYINLSRLWKKTSHRSETNPGPSYAAGRAVRRVPAARQPGSAAPPRGRRHGRATVGAGSGRSLALSPGGPWSCHQHNQVCFSIWVIILL